MRSLVLNQIYFRLFYQLSYPFSKLNDVNTRKLDGAITVALPQRHRHRYHGCKIRDFDLFIVSVFVRPCL